MARLWETREVLAGAYKGNRENLEWLKTHVVELAPDGSDRAVLCGRVRLANIADANSGNDVTAEATCRTCARMDPRHPPTSGPVA